VENLERQLIEGLIDRLEELRETGARFAPIRAETLRDLARPPRPTPAPASEAPPPPAGPPVATQKQPSLLSSTRSAPPPEDKEKALEALRKDVLACRKCPHLAAARRHVVFGVGNPRSPLLFVGEAPGVDEDRQGEPFVGRAGQLLTKIIEAMGLTRSDVYIANILKCRPDTPGRASGNRKPTPAEMITCLPWLLEQIRILQPQVIVALGATAVEGLLGKQAAGRGITRLRGNWLEFEGVPLMPTYHPAYLLRNPTLQEKRKVWEDMLQVMERLGLPISEKQRNYFLKRP